MPTWVLVQTPQGQAPNRPVFVNRRFNGAAGSTGTPFQVAIGVNTFSLRSPTAITWESTANCPDVPRDNPFLIMLAPFAPAVLGMRTPAEAAPIVVPSPPEPKTAKKKAR